MTYFEILLGFILPPLVALAIFVPADFWRWLGGKGPRRDWLPYGAILLHALIALVYTTPWDNYLVATGVWWYNPALVTGITLGWVPVEEYTFFVLQSLLTGLWTVLMLRHIPAAPLRANPRLRLGASLGIVILWMLSAALWFSGWQPGVYLALILVWALPPLLLQVAFGIDILLAHGRALLAGILIPTLYLWILDATAITAGTWTIDPLQTTGLKLGLLPMEEMLFFLATNVILGFGITLLCSPVSLERLKSIRLFKERKV